jgi:hypothetical protein
MPPHLSWTLIGVCQLCGADVHVVENDQGVTRWMDDLGSVTCMPGIFHEPGAVRVVVD